MTRRAAPLLAAALAAIPGWVADSPAAAQPGAFKPKKSKLEIEADRAVARAMDWLRKAAEAGAFPDDNGCTSQELVLYTLHHGGGPRQDPLFQKLLKYVLDKEPHRVYDAALAAMALSAIDKAEYQGKLAQLAQFLVDNQCKNGQWLYGEPVPPAKITVTPGGRNGKASGGGGTTATRRLPKVRIQQRRRGPEDGDHSNSQYAALGLRACAEANIEIDPKCLADALQWWEKAQCADGGWDYKQPTGAGYGGMTAGAVSAITIYHWLQEKPYGNHPGIQKGFQWFKAHWDVTQNPNAKNVKPETGRFIHYYLYALERAGMIYGTNAIGGHEWYEEGAAFLLKSQQSDGCWKEPSVDVWNTCFAILFLRRATKPLPPKVYTG